jgi:hypothetical protein
MATVLVNALVATLGAVSFALVVSRARVARRRAKTVAKRGLGAAGS